MESLRAGNKNRRFKELLPRPILSYSQQTLTHIKRTFGAQLCVASQVQCESTIAEVRLKAISLTCSYTPPVIDSDLEPSQSQLACYTPILHTEQIWFLNMECVMMERASIIWFFSSFTMWKLLMQAAQPRVLLMNLWSENDGKKKKKYGKVIKTGNYRRARCVLRAKKTLVVNNFPSNRPIRYGV